MLMASVGSAMLSIHRGRRAGAAIAALLGVLALAAGCGEPEFRYVSNTDEQTYFKVPHSWQEIDSEVIDDSFDGIENDDSIAVDARRQLWWSVAYDSDELPAPEHMTDIGTSQSPVLYVSIRRQLPFQRDMTSFDLMRDVFLPVSETRREMVAQAGAGLAGFEALYDEVLNGEDGVHGVRTVFSYEMPTGILHTFDQTVYANQDSTVLYIMLIRCTARCYRERAVELNDIATSFTVRSKV
jgi:hypothetical protein